MTLPALQRSAWTGCWPGAAVRLAAAVCVAAGISAAQAQAEADPATVSSAAEAASAPAAGAGPEVRAADLREEVQHIAVTVKDMFGREETGQIPLTIFRPAGDGPHPLVVLSHGRAVAAKRAQQGRQRYEAQARYLVSKGFVVIVPTRMGYGATYGDFDPEASGGCNVMRLEPMALAASDQVLAAVAHARSLPFVDASRWVAMGASVGGLATVAVAARNPPGLMAAINFAGGTGGDPDTRPGKPCLPVNIERHWGSLAAQTRLPMLWLYWENDRYWGAENPRRWAKAWEQGGGTLQFHQLPPAGTDGHSGMGIDMDSWVPLVEAYLAQAGFTRAGLVARPPPSGFAAVADADQVPTTRANRDTLYKRFLAAKPPRAFALGPNGAAGYASGDWALGRALGFCQARRGAPCKFYAVDDDVVWTP
jgi:dienelactone hydrolase